MSKPLILFIAILHSTAVWAAESRQSQMQQIDALFEEIAPQVQSVPAIRAAQIQSTAKQHRIWIDVRPAEERAISTIAGAWTEAQLREKFASIPADTQLVFYCTVGLRSGLAAEKWRAKGWNVRNLAGGVLAWINAGGTIVDARGKTTQRVHTYAKKWAVVPENFNAVY